MLNSMNTTEDLTGEVINRENLYVHDMYQRYKSHKIPVAI